MRAIYILMCLSTGWTMCCDNRALMQAHSVARNKLAHDTFWGDVNPCVRRPYRFSYADIKARERALYQRLSDVQTTYVSYDEVNLFACAELDQLEVRLRDDNRSREIGVLFQKGYNAWRALHDHLQWRNAES